MKNPFKRQKDKGIPTASTPRTFDEIKKEFVDLRAQAGELQYQVALGKRNLEMINNRLVQVHNEANEREKLDKAVAAEKAAANVAVAANLAKATEAANAGSNPVVNQPAGVQ